MLFKSAFKSEKYYLKWWNQNYKLYNTYNSACSQSAIYIFKNKYKK